MVILSIAVASDARPDSVPLTLRPLADEDASAVQEMLDDPSVREAMGWRDGEHRDAAQMIAAAQAEQGPYYRFRYTFGVVPEGAVTVVGVAVVRIEQVPPAQIPPLWQTDLTIFFAQRFRGLGYGRRTLTRLRDWCFDELRLTSPFGDSVPMSKVTAVCLPSNVTSQALLSDLLIPLGATVLEHTADGSPVDALSFEMSREQYEISRRPRDC